MPVDPWGQHQTGFERLGRQRPQQRRFPDAVLTDGADPVTDPAMIIGPVILLQAGVQLRQGRYLRDRHQMGAAEPAALTLHATLLVSALDASTRPATAAISGRRLAT
jgi:hypothetical protein